MELFTCELCRKDTLNEICNGCGDTGAKDKNGARIYDGNEVRVEVGDTLTFGVVRYEDFGWVIRSGQYHKLTLSKDLLSFIEIVK